jgi:ABC-2 type transport system ATP-binding protein
MAATAPPLRFRGTRREYGGVVALDHLDLTVEAGTCVVLAGRNGSGKTTTLQLAAGRLDPTDGSVEVDGRPTDTTFGREHVREAVSFALDTPVFYPDLTVEEHLGFVATAHGVEDADAHIEDLLAALDLDRRRGFLPDQLSAGMRQKVQLACLLLRPGRVVLLDEPSRALDPHTRDVLWAALAARKAAGSAVVFSTHQLDFPPDLADEALVLHDGEVRDHGDYATVVAGEAAAELGLA